MLSEEALYKEFLREVAILFSEEVLESLCAELTLYHLPEPVPLIIEPLALEGIIPSERCRLGDCECYSSSQEASLVKSSSQ